MFAYLFLFLGPAAKKMTAAFAAFWKYWLFLHNIVHKKLVMALV